MERDFLLIQVNLMPLKPVSYPVIFTDSLILLALYRQKALPDAT